MRLYRENGLREREVMLKSLLAVFAGMMVTLAGCGVHGPGTKAIIVGNGHSELKDAKEAGSAAAKQARATLGDKNAKLVIVFDSVGKDINEKQRLLEGVGSVFDSSIVYGCSSYSPLTQYSNSGTVGVLAISGKVGVTSAVADLEHGHEVCGKKIGESLKEAGLPKSKGRLLLLFGSCHVPSNDKLVSGVRGVLGDKFPIVGGAAAGGEYLYNKGQIVRKSNLGILLAGDFECSFSAKKDNSPEGLITSAGDAFREAIGGDEDNVVIAFAFDCGGRRGKMGGNLSKELEAMKAVARNTPIFGFYGSGEIGHEDNDSPSRGVGYHLAVCSVFTE